jgi:hypothetical protein
LESPIEGGNDSSAITAPSRLTDRVSGVVKVERHRAQRWNSFVVLELVAAVVFLGAPAEHLDDECWVRNRVLVSRITFERPADNGRVGVGCEACFEDANPQVGIVNAAAPPISAGRTNATD